MKKYLFAMAVFAVVAMGGLGIAYAADPQEGAPWTRLWQVVITNWPENQNVTLTNSEPIEVTGDFKETNYKKITIGSEAVFVENKISLGEPQERILYASYQGRGKMVYGTVVGAKGVGIQIETDGRRVAYGDAYDICTIFDGSGVGDGWKCLIKDWITERHGALEINNEYPFEQEIKIYLYRVTTDTSISGAHIELLVEE